MDNELRKKIIDEFASGNVTEATELLLENVPQYLYRYRSGKSYDIDALKKKKMGKFTSKIFLRKQWNS